MPSFWKTTAIATATALSLTAAAVGQEYTIKVGILGLARG